MARIIELGGPFLGGNRVAVSFSSEAGHLQGIFPGPHARTKSTFNDSLSRSVCSQVLVIMRESLAGTAGQDTLTSIDQYIAIVRATQLTLGVSMGKRKVKGAKFSGIRQVRGALGTL